MKREESASVMKSKQFPSMEAAEEYLNSRGGDLKYYGREGTDAKTYVYTLTIGVKIYHLLVHEDGLLEVTGESYL